MLAHGDVVLELETEHVPVEGQGLRLVVDEHTGYRDLHGLLPPCGLETP